MINYYKQLIGFFNHLIDEGIKSFNSNNQEAYEKNLRLTAKIIRDVCINQQVDIALGFEVIWYNQLVKKVEKEEHYYKAFQWHSAAMWSAGKDRSPGLIKPTDSKHKKIMFLAHNGFYLGHIAVTVQVMKDWKTIFPDVQIFFLALNGVDKKLKDELKEIEVTLLSVPTSLVSPTKRIEWVRAKNIEMEINTAIWLSTPCWVNYVFGYGVAARQFLWSLKFHPVYLGEAVTHIGMTKSLSGYECINGNKWKAYQPPLAVDIRKINISEIDKVKSSLPKGFLFGTLARDEKFNSSEFVQSIIQILQSCPDSYFLYTGKINSPILLSALQEAKLEDRGIYVGWVEDTNIYAKLLDVFLETYPFGCGVTGMQALSHGTKVISMWSDNTLPRFYFENIKDAQLFSPNWVITSDRDRYVKSSILAYQENKVIESITDMKGKITDLDKSKSAQLYKLIYE